MKFHSDAVTKEIVAGLRERDIFVIYLKALSRLKGLHDLLIAYAGVTYMVEIKSAKGDLSDEQRTFHAAWRGGPQGVARTLEEVLVLIGYSMPHLEV
jgi:hypothetical protein